MRTAGSGDGFAREVGARVRALRLERGMTQTELGRPLTRAFVSAVELGRVLPSLRALALMAERLRVPIAALIPGNPLLSVEYTERRARDHAPPHRR